MKSNYITSITIISFLLTSNLLFSANIYVPANYPTIQQAINAAVNGDVVIVSDGTYSGTNNINLSWSSKHITVKSASNNPDNCVINCSSTGQPAFYFLNTGQNSSDLIMGFKIINATRSGVFCNGASPIINNLKISNCVNTYYTQFGGGGMCFVNSTASVIGSTINNCGQSNTGYGGGIYVGMNSSLSISNSTISQNLAWQGGGLWIKNATLYLSSSTISNNTSTANGGGLYFEASTVSIDGITMTGNITTQSTSVGGGLCAFAGGSLNVSNSNFESNSGYKGGGLFVNALLTMNNCQVNNNQATNSGNGGGIFLADAIYNISYSVFSYNQAAKGGAIYFSALDEFNLDKCTITNNTAGNNNGGGIYYYGGGYPYVGTMSINNSIIWNNNGGGIAYSSSANYINCTYTDLQNGSSAPFYGQGCINLNPLFVNSSSDYNLKCGSPCIDTGDPSYPLDPDTTRTDMGKYQFNWNEQLPAFNMSPTTLNFGQVPLSQIKDLQITISNTGCVDLTVNSIVVTGNYYEFYLIGGAPFTITPGNSRNIKVRFHPQSLGSKSATLNITTNAPGSPYTIPLSGIAVEPSDFIQVTNIFTPIIDGDAEWADFNRDGLLDLIEVGRPFYLSYIFKIYKNTGNGFVESYAFNNDTVSYKGIMLNDYDNDGYVDVLLVGLPNQNHLFKNNGNFNFSFISGIPENYAYRHGIAWSDFDNDGLSDIGTVGLINIDTTSNRSCKVYKNTGSGFEETYSLDGLGYGSSISWTDYDNDQDFDLITAGGTDPDNVPSTFLYENVTSAFNPVSNSLVGLILGDSRWGDFDADGLIDLALYGNTINSTADAKCLIYKNNGSNFTQFNDLSQSSNDYFTAANWGDYNNDGYLDIVIASHHNPTFIFSNIGSTFEPSVNLIEAKNGETTWGDYDNDGDLDLIMVGWTDGLQPNATLYKNLCSTPNSAPAIPTNLSSSFSDNLINFNWNKSTDAQTPQNGLTYNLRIGTNPGGCEIMSPMSLSDGKRLVVDQGNCALNNSWHIKKPGFGVYYWSVQAIDNCFAGSAFAQETTFIVAPTSDFTIPSNAQSNENVSIVYTGDGSQSATFDWDFDGGVIVSGSGQGPYTVYWSTPGVKSVSLMVTENGASSPLTTHQIAIAPTSSFILPARTVVQQPVTIIYSGTGSYGAVYNWDFDGGYIISGSGQGPYSVYWLTSGIKNVSLTVIENGATSSITTNTIAVAPTSLFSMPSYAQAMQSVSIIYTGSANNTANYMWDFDGANITSGAGQGPYSVYWSAPGSKLVKLMVIENFVSSDTTSHSIIIGSGVGIEDKTRSIIIYPNPVRQKLTIQYELEGLNTLCFQFFNVFGTLLQKDEISAVEQGANHTIDVSNWAPGVYMCKIFVNNDPENPIVYKIIKTSY
jgi:hypothetical protein